MIRFDLIIERPPKSNSMLPQIVFRWSLPLAAVAVALFFLSIGIGIAKWNRYWFVLNDGVLYYFVAPQFQDQAPRCIIPLEGIGVDPIGITDLSISTKASEAF